MLLHLASALALLVVSLGIGVVGYEVLEHLPFVDALLNPAMLLGGMGPVNAPVTQGGKVFATVYALYAGLVFIVTAVLILAPLVHRPLHRSHWEDKP
jgi:hypothetical protein